MEGPSRGRIVLFGATGFTGALTARAMARAGDAPVLAGRDARRLRALANDLGGLETRVADATDPSSLAGLLRPGDVLVSTAGPFRRIGETAVRAAIAAGAHYLDSTGETAFIRDVHARHGAAAAQVGCALVPAFGFDWVPGNLAGALALRRAGGAARRVDVGYVVTGRAAASGGTRASGAGMLLEPAMAWRDGRLVAEPVARRARAFEVPDLGGGGAVRRVAAVSVGGSEHLALPRCAPQLREIGVYLGAGRRPRAVQAVALGAWAATRIPGARRGLSALAQRAFPVSTGGQDAAARARTGCIVLAEAFGPRGGAPLSTVRLRGPNPYDLTAELLAWGARMSVSGGLAATGALGPVQAFGLEALERGCAEAGLVRV